LSQGRRPKRRLHYRHRRPRSSCCAIDAARVGIRPRPGDYTATAITANGKIKAARATIDRIEIGGITVYDVPAMVLPDEALAKNLLGASFLSRLKRYEYANGRIVLEQ
jgi:aspartyl protease family protein